MEILYFLNNNPIAIWDSFSIFNLDNTSIKDFSSIDNSKKYGFSLKVPFSKLSEEAKSILFYGTGEEKIKIARKTNFMNILKSKIEQEK